MADILAKYTKRNPFYFQAGIMLLMCSLICWIFGTKESYLNLGTGLLVIYLIQYAIESLVNKAIAKREAEKI